MSMILSNIPSDLNTASLTNLSSNQDEAQQSELGFLVLWLQRLLQQSFSWLNCTP